MLWFVRIHPTPRLPQRSKQRHYPWLAFFCSNRNSNKGCGRSFSILFCEFIANCSVTSFELYSFVNKLTEHQSVTDAWREADRNGFPLSLASAHRWFHRFKLHIHQFRSKLFQQTHPPPSEKVIASPNQDIAITIEMFDEANRNVTNDPFAAFQLQHQTPLF